MRTLLLSTLAVLAFAPYAWAYAAAATLTITPDQTAYQVGDTITLNVAGDSEGAEDNRIYGRLLFDANLADYVASHQEPLRNSRGGLQWCLFALTGGEGFAEAFSQFPCSENPEFVDGPLSASVTLLATAPGTLHYSWQTEGNDDDLFLDFFGLREAPGGEVLIVPEVSTGSLLGLGVIAIAIARRRARFLAGFATVALGPYALGATLTITPDQMVYQVGDTITLNVVGDAEGAEDNAIYGRMVFNANLANYVASHQEKLRNSAGGLLWCLVQLTGGDGFAEAFAQYPCSTNPEFVDGPLSASVTLLATAPGVLHYSWQTEGDNNLFLDFFGLREAPGGDVLIVPELSTGSLLGLGVIVIAIARRTVWRR